MTTATPPSRLASGNAVFAITFVSYAIFVLGMWAPFGPYNGMSYETNFALQSQTSTIWNGFFFGDALRIHTNFFYQISYLASKALGISGSWFAYQLVYALLWLARGVLCYAIVRRLVPSAPMFAYLVGALSIFHASDHTLNWVGQLNQFGFIFWMLLGFFFILRGLEAADRPRAVVWALLAAACYYMSLWSYEAQLFAMLLAPLLLAMWKKTLRSRFFVILIALAPAFVFIALNIHRYRQGGGGDYQVSVLRSDMTIANLFADLLFNLKYALEFWHWAELMPAKYVNEDYVVAPICTALAFLVGGLIYARATRAAASLPTLGTQSLMFVGGALLLCATFPAFLILNSSRWLWRTQTLGGPFASLMIATLIGLVAVIIGRAFSRHRRLLEPLCMILCGAVIAFYGVRSSERIASFHFDTWEHARETIAGVLQVAPQVTPDTNIVLLDVPRRTAGVNVGDPFGDNMWFDTAMKLAHPSARPNAYYFFEGGEPAPNNRFAELPATSALDSLLILRWRSPTQYELVTDVPERMKFSSATSGEYHPERRIIPGPATREGTNRYIRFAAPWLR